MNSKSPRGFNLPHDVWRPGQYEAVTHILNDRTDDAILLQAMTGSGKSAIGAALGAHGRTVRALTFTKSLQAQYANTMPDMEEIYGLDSYPCYLYPGMNFTAKFCQYPTEMNRCPEAHRCDYLIRREITRRAVRQALSYQYYLKASWPHKEVTDRTYCDEAHSMPDVIMDFMTMIIKPGDYAKHGLPPIPSTPSVDGVKKKILANWLFHVFEVADEKRQRIDAKAFKSAHDVGVKLWLGEVATRSKAIGQALEDYPDLMYVVGDQMELKIFPLTPAPFFWRLFGSQNKLILASATIGDPKTFAELLGLGKRWSFYEVTPQFGPDADPVYYFKGAPKMSYRSGDAAYKKQADLIARVAGNFSGQAHGLVHCSSIATAKRMAELLAKKFGSNRVWVPNENVSTEQKLADWEDRKRRVPGTVAVAYSFHTGIDGPDVSWNVLQKAPYRPLDEVGEQLLKRNPEYYGWIAAVTAEQATGRIRRGFPEHYEEPGQPVRKMVAVIDGNIHRLRPMFSNHFKNRLRSY